MRRVRYPQSGGLGVNATAMEGSSRVLTGVGPDPRTPGYVVVELDGLRFASLPQSVLEDHRLRIGEALDDGAFRVLSDAADVEAACQVAIRLLATRPRSFGEMRRALRERGHGPGAIEGAVERLGRRGLLDDDAYARHFARVRCHKGHGPVRLIADLRSRGVDGRLAERVVQDVLQEEEVDHLDQARQLARRRLAQLGGIPADAQRRRVLAFLGRRGHGGWEVRRIVDEIIAED